MRFKRSVSHTSPEYRKCISMGNEKYVPGRMTCLKPPNQLLQACCHFFDTLPTCTTGKTWLGQQGTQKAMQSPQGQMKSCHCEPEVNGIKLRHVKETCLRVALLLQAATVKTLIAILFRGNTFRFI